MSFKENWKELSGGKGVAFILALVCTVVCFVLLVLQIMDVLPDTRTITTALLAGVNVSSAILQERKGLKIALFVVAGLETLICVLHLLGK